MLKIIIFLPLLLMLFDNSFGFNECPISHSPYPGNKDINNCLQLLAFLKSQGQNVAQWCSNQNNYQQCCITCQNIKSDYNTCKNLAYNQDCDLKAKENKCNQIMANNLPVSYFCAKSCGNCNVPLSCSTLSSGCNGGKCYPATYFSEPSVNCVCPSTKGGTYCQQYNSCSISPCLNQGECIPLYEQHGRYVCNCKPGFNGPNCQYIMVGCGGSIACQNGGTCQTSANGAAYCSCPSGYIGTSCESYRGGCLQNFCQNGGSCIPTHTSPTYYCVCNSQFTGYNCQTQRLCSTFNYCQNGGTCVESNNGGTPICQCKNGFSGVYCEKSSVGCGNSPCLNKGTCISLNENNYICVCSVTYFGKNCEFTNLGCDNTVCQNGGSCVLNSNNKPICLCESSFTGTNCETFIGSCNPLMCINGGTCLPNAYNGLNKCICPPMYTGNNCELLINCDRGDQSISQCRSWSSLGFCNLKYTYNGVSVPMYCPISCNMCNQQCTDAVNECSNWATQGLCGSIVSQNNGLCRKSCNQCYYTKMKTTEVAWTSKNETIAVEPTV